MGLQPMVLIQNAVDPVGSVIKLEDVGHYGGWGETLGFRAWLHISLLCLLTAEAT